MKTIKAILSIFQNFVFRTSRRKVRDRYLKRDPSAALRINLAKAIKKRKSSDAKEIECISRFRITGRTTFLKGRSFVSPLFKTQKRVAITACGLVLLGLSACIKTFDYETNNYEQILVVEGNLSDADEVQQVQLSYTRPLDNTAAKTEIEDAIVYVQLGSGERANYTHQGLGVYISEADFKAVEGETYQLVIELADRSIVTSNELSFIPSPPMDSIYGREIEIPSEELNRNETGVQLFIDSQDPTGRANFFRYDWDATYKIFMPYGSLFIYDYDTGVISSRVDPVSICYSNDTSNQIVIATSTTNANNRLAAAPIHFVSNELDHLRAHYSIKVRQYAIDEQAFLYYKKLKETNESTGSLFDVQQGSVIGNLTYTENANIPVLGYFEVAGVTELRRYFKPKDIPDFRAPSFRFKCGPSDLMESPADSVGFYLTNPLLSIYDFEFPFGPYILAPRTCTDCSWYASTIKPEWWIE